jgi:hybrid cluster-associated redox disulfide protein
MKSEKKRKQENKKKSPKEKSLIITKDMSILEIIDKKPEVIEVLFEFGLGCISCAFSQVETLEQGALGHGMSEEVINKMIEEMNKIEPENTW